MSVLAFVRTPDAKPITPENDVPSAPVSLQSLTDFTNATATVWSYSLTVTQTNLTPVIPAKEPDWFNALNKNLTGMKTHAQSWIDTTGPSLVSIPQAIINFNNKFEGQFDIIMDILTAIGTGTPTKEQKTNLLTEMNSLLDELNKQKATINATNQHLIGFADNLTSDNTALTTGAASVTNAIKSDKQDVIAQNGLIKNLRADIEKWTTIATAAEVAMGLSFFAAAIGLWMTIATFGAGGLVLAAGVVGFTAALATTIAANVILSNDAKAIVEKQNNIHDDNKQIIVLNTVAATVDGLVTKNKAAGQAMATILADWGTLTQRMKAVIDDIHDAEGDIGSILDIGDMKTTKLAWTDLSTFAKSMQGSLGSVALAGKVALNKAA